MADFEPKPRYEGTFKAEGKKIHFNKTWGGHDFSDEECEALLNGDPVEFDAVSKRTGKPYHVKGTLEKQEFNGSKFYGFQPDFAKK